MTKLHAWIRVLSLMLLATAMLANAGCIGGLAQMLYVIRGHKSPAEFEGLKGHKVAVVCVSDASSYGPDTLTKTITTVVGYKLKSNIRDITVIPHSQVQEWIDRNGWDESDFTAIGSGIGADKILAIEIADYSIHEGSTIYKGRADVTATVYDVESGGTVDYVYGPSIYQFPEHGRPAINTTDRQFESVYLAKLTQHIARRFYAHDQLDEVADDASAFH